MTYVVTGVPALEGHVNVLMTTVYNPTACVLGAVKPKPPLGGVDVSMHAPTPAEENYAIPIPYNSDYDIIRYYFIPMKVVDPAVTDNTIFGIICQSFGRTYWMLVNPTLAYKLEFKWASTVFPLTTGPQPPIQHFKIVSNGSTGTIQNVLTGKYVKAIADTPIFSLETTNIDPYCQFKFYWHTGTGPVMSTDRNATTPNVFHILTSQGKALVGSDTAPFISWAALDVASNAQKFYFYSVSSPTLSSGNAPFVYNMLCVDVPGYVYCFGEDDTISLCPVDQAGDWEKLAVEVPSSAADHFCRFNVTGTSFLARLRAHADVTGSVTLADANSLLTIEDFFFVLPADRVYINPKDTKAPAKAASKCVAPPDALSEVVAPADRPLNVTLSGGACLVNYDSATRRPNGSPTSTSTTALLLLALLACLWLWVAHYY